MCAIEPRDALDMNCRRAGAFDLRSHRGEQRGEVGDFGLASAILHHGFAFGQNGGHQQVFGAGDGDLVEDDVCPFEFVGAGFEVAVLLRDSSAHFFQTLDVKVNGSAPDGASSGHGDAGHACTRYQRSKDEGTGAHRLDDFVLGFGIGEGAEVDPGAVVCVSSAEFDFGAHGHQEFALGFDVADLRDVFEGDFFLGQDGSGHTGQG